MYTNAVRYTYLQAEEQAASLLAATSKLRSQTSRRGRTRLRSAPALRAQWGPLPSEFTNLNFSAAGKAVETAAGEPFAVVEDANSSSSAAAAAAAPAAADAGIDADVQAVLDRAIAARKYAEHIAEGGSLDGSSTTATTTATSDQRLQKQPLSATCQLAAAQKGSLADPRQYFGGLDTAATAGSRL
eukprot:4976-Heterococcus_DN1.PRE.1